MFLPYQDLVRLTTGQSPMIRFGKGLEESRIQPASVDCPLGDHAYCMRSAAIPNANETVSDLIKRFCRYDFAIRPEGSVLEKGVCYVIPLDIELSLTKELMAIFSPKSSVGRNDVFVRVLSDRGPRYDATANGYSGRLYLEVTPLSFSAIVVPGLDLTQMRLRRDISPLRNYELQQLHSVYGLVRDVSGKVIENGSVEIEDDSLYLHIDLDREIVGFEARENPAVEVCLHKKNHHDPSDFWLPIKRPVDGQLILTPGRFYLLATKERVFIPKETCAEVVTYDVAAGEFRSHYAGFFDNNFGGENGTNAVLEVRVRDVPFRVYDGQRICRMVFEKTEAVPEKLYGAGIGSTYTVTGPCLAKHYRDCTTVWL